MPVTSGAAFEALNFAAQTRALAQSRTAAAAAEAAAVTAAAQPLPEGAVLRDGSVVMRSDTPSFGALAAVNWLVKKGQRGAKLPENLDFSQSGGQASVSTAAVWAALRAPGGLHLVALSVAHAQSVADACGLADNASVVRTAVRVLAQLVPDEAAAEAAEAAAEAAEAGGVAAEASVAGGSSLPLLVDLPPEVLAAMPLVPMPSPITWAPDMAAAGGCMPIPDWLASFGSLTPEALPLVSGTPFGTTGAADVMATFQAAACTAQVVGTGEVPSPEEFSIEGEGQRLRQRRT